MSKGIFPKLLKNRATLLLSLARADLLMLGGLNLFLSWMKISGLVAFVISFVFYVISNLIQTRLPKGFFKVISKKRILSWSYKVGDLYE